MIVFVVTTAVIGLSANVCSWAFSALSEWLKDGFYKYNY